MHNWDMFKDHPVTVGFSVCRPSPLSKPEICRRLCQEVREREKGRGTRKEGKRGRFQAGGARERQMRSHQPGYCASCYQESWKYKSSNQSIHSLLCLPSLWVSWVFWASCWSECGWGARRGTGMGTISQTGRLTGGRTHLLALLKMCSHLRHLL